MLHTGQQYGEEGGFVNGHDLPKIVIHGRHRTKLSANTFGRLTKSGVETGIRPLSWPKKP